MQEESIDFQKLVLSIVQRKKEEEEKKSIPSHTSIHVYTQCNTHGEALLLCAFFPLGKKL